MMTQDYDFVWNELNRQLHAVEQSGGGLVNVIRELQANQYQSGFIKVGYQNIARYIFYHPEDRNRLFRVQYNPKRALRLNGSGIKLPPPGVAVKHNGCFLCRDNIVWQQQGAELGYELRVNGNNYMAWMNPFPLCSSHIVVAAAEHVNQDWSLHATGELDPRQLLHDLVELAQRLPGYIGFYNGVGAGSSIPGHMHLQFCKRHIDDPRFPLERARHDYSATEGSRGEVRGYPLAVVVWRGPYRQVIEEASDWLQQWARRNQSRLNNLTANFVATKERDDDAVRLYFTPRERTSAHSSGMSDLVGGLEVTGEFVFTRPEERQHLEQGIVNYFTLEKILADIHTPLYIN